MSEKINYSALKKGDIENLHKEAEEKLKETNKELNTFKDELSELKEMFKIVLANSNNSQPQQIMTTREEDIFMATTNNRRIVVTVDGKEIIFGANGQFIPMTREEVNTLIKSKDKRLVINGLIRFEDPKYYDEFRVYPIMDLTDKGIVELFEKSSEEIVKVIQEAQRKSPKPYMLTHAITYIIGAMILDDKLKMDYNKVTPLEKFLKVDIKGDVIGKIQMARQLGYYR